MRNEEKVRRNFRRGHHERGVACGAVSLLGILITVVVEEVIVAARADRIVGDDE